jgi:glycosyltransferase involved in cell wall biosynthesis
MMAGTDGLRIARILSRKNAGPSTPDRLRDRPSSVLLISRWYGGANNGVGVLTETLAQSLRAAGTQCIVVELLPDGVFPRRRIGRSGETIWGVCLRVRGEHSSARAPLAQSLRSFLCRRLIRRLVRTNGVSVAHFHHASTLYETIASTLRATSTPWMVTFHGSDLRADISEPRCHAVMLDLVTRAGAVSAVSESLREAAVRAFPDAAAKTSVIYNSVEVALVEEAKDVAANGLDAKVVVFLGVLGKRKGADVLLDAWVDLVRSGGAPPPWTLVIAGDGPDKPGLESIAKDAGVADRVRFVGATARSDIATLLTGGSIMVVPSRTEPFGLVAAEGQMLGRPIVASDTGGLPEVIEDGVTGLLVPVEDAGALAAAIASLIAEPARRRSFGHAAHERAMLRFSPGRMAEEYLSRYSAIVAAHS